MPTSVVGTSPPTVVCVSMLPLGIVARRFVGRGMSDRVCCISTERRRSEAAGETSD